MILSELLEDFFFFLMQALDDRKGRQLTAIYQVNCVVVFYNFGNTTYEKSDHTTLGFKTAIPANPFSYYCF